MRCSWCESALDAYVEGLLEPARARALAVHLRTCAPCESLHRRLRVVDALLVTARRPALDSNFTARLMADVRDLPAPPPVHKPLLPLAAFYLVAAWIAALAVLFLRLRLPIETGAIAGAASGAAHAIAQGAHALSPLAPVAIPAVVGVLVLDALLVGGLVVFYRRVRPRLTAYLRVPVEAA